MIPCATCGEPHDRRHGRNKMRLKYCSKRCSLVAEKAMRGMRKGKPEEPEEQTKSYKNGRCDVCEGQSWRRHWAGCKGCGKPYEAEPKPQLQSGYSTQSPIAAAEDIAPGIIGIRNGIKTRDLPGKVFPTCCHRTMQKKKGK